MSRRLAIAILVSALPLALAACGGSAHSSSSSSIATTSASASATTSATATTSTTTTAVTSGRPPEVPASKARSSKSNPTAPDTNVRLPAAFAIEPGGNLTPPLVAAPKGVAIQLQLHNLDSRPHAFVLEAPKRYSAQIQPRGRTTALITGLRKGTYRILVDGATRGQLVIGSVPGP